MGSKARPDLSPAAYVVLAKTEDYPFVGASWAVSENPADIAFAHAVGRGEAALYGAGFDPLAALAHGECCWAARPALRGGGR
ncbi:hypothetical protein ACVOMT_06350 [Sphingomonas panni]